MCDDHVAEGAGLLVEAGAAADADEADSDFLCWRVRDAASGVTEGQRGASGERRSSGETVRSSSMPVMLVYV